MPQRKGFQGRHGAAQPPGNRAIIAQQLKFLGGLFLLIIVGGANNHVDRQLRMTGVPGLEKKPIRRIIIEIHTKIIQALRESDETALVEVVNEHLKLALDAIRGQMSQ